MIEKILPNSIRWDIPMYRVRRIFDLLEKGSWTKEYESKFAWRFWTVNVYSISYSIVHQQNVFQIKYIKYKDHNMINVLSNTKIQRYVTQLDLNINQK